jgi:hypothetical protein
MSLFENMMEHWTSGPPSFPPSFSKSKLGNLLYLQGLIGTIPVRVLVNHGAFTSFINSKTFQLLGKHNNESKRLLVITGDGSGCSTQGFLDVTLCLGSDANCSL